MGDSSDVPAVPAPSAVAGTQFDYNKLAGAATQSANSTNQYTPFGSLTYDQRGTDAYGMPLYTATTKLDPAQQGILDALNRYKTTAGNNASQVLDNANYGGTSAKDFVGGYTSGLTKEMLDKEVGYLDPYFTRDKDYLDTKLKNQGIEPSSPAYKTAMDNLRQSQGGIVTNFLASAQPTAFNQAYQLYQAPLATAAGLSGGAQPGMPSWVTTPTSTVQPPNFIGATNNAQDALEKNYQSQMTQHGNMMSGMFGIPTAILGGYAGSAGGSAAISAALGAMM